MAFGDFGVICERSPLPLCSLIDSKVVDIDSTFTGIIPTCYARSINLANTLIFQVGTAFVHISALVILMMIVYIIRDRYTAVGRREMLFFFWSYMGLTIFSLVVDTGVSPPGSTTYAYFVAAQIGFMAACSWSLFYAGLTSFNLWDDGSISSMSVLYVSSVIAFAVDFIVALLTFKGWASTLGPHNTTPLFVFMYVLNGILLVSWFLCQIFVCFFILIRNWWAIGALAFVCFFYVASQVLLYAVSQQICESVKHYVDGLMFSVISSLFCVMMIYKYYDIITYDDDEYYRQTQIIQSIPEKNDYQLM
ncbi:unnamed protein product [[Candida] boidinii]|uniref:Chitin synthase export chaperone n=1 Tax=Candida boidinii TaxID=5477 RepID=A0A9W6SZ75_CANBO|nr:hypothetical protein B5S30_g882 [[Candida] boidinii]OWB84443.1 hypothetical protein B5S33_g3089 [[Candida] boidinii]GME69223.1 unnamed protein product [[Candida] boidinii]GMG00154.1 unnamed protein product [[Candida] boidinii]